MALFKNLKIHTIAGFQTVTKGIILVPYAQSINALFQEFVAATSPSYPPRSVEEANDLLKSFGVWCATSKNYTVSEDTGISL